MLPCIDYLRFSADSSEPDAEPDVDPTKALDDKSGSGGDMLRPRIDDGSTEGLELSPRVKTRVGVPDFGGTGGGCESA